MKWLLLKLIGLYQKYLSPLKRPCCKYYPSCSAYAVSAVEKHGALKGAILAVWRIMRCNPWSMGGVDYVPEKFHLYTLKGEARRQGKTLD